MNVNNDVEKLLNGEGLEVNDEFDSAPAEVQAVALRKTITYIVSAVIFNEKNEVLMVQEAKENCYKQWYLPAGRMEEGESIVEAMKREVKEEAGFDCKPITLVLVQEQGPQWIRFVFLAEITGGSLKTTAEADGESLQAQWWDQDSPLTLRGRDILRLIDTALKYRKKPWHPVAHPIDMCCHVVVQRLLLTFSSSDGVLWLLLGNIKDLHLPVAVSVKTHTVTWAANKLVQEAMPSSYYDLNVNTRGILGLQHNGRVPGKTDGLCFNTVVSLEHTGEGPHTSQPPLIESPRFQWYKVENPQLRDQIQQRITTGSFLPVHSLY
ncbi:8-oxo-dGDP phosphatase NUDT18 isoform X1 [Salvelinus namaycush]|uniref:8-oxo-dGDP phosphatase NUDT18 n=2 Tax=Salvelinus namaycush TaxID=8040 RepID=A0A8U0QPH3_SALNM|nr:8-oxo-dGDP phosphatase NUDT18 isoform X1 [Salvelinus namaycush]